MKLSFHFIQCLFLAGTLVVEARRLGQTRREVEYDEEEVQNKVVRKLQPGAPNYGLTPSEHEVLYGYADGAGVYGGEYYDGGDYARGTYGDPWDNPSYYAFNPQLDFVAGGGGAQGRPGGAPPGRPGLGRPGGSYGYEGVAGTGPYGGAIAGERYTGPYGGSVGYAAGYRPGSGPTAAPYVGGPYASGFYGGMYGGYGGAAAYGSYGGPGGASGYRYGYGSGGRPSYGYGGAAGYEYISGPGGAAGYGYGPSGYVAGYERYGGAGHYGHGAMHGPHAYY